MFKPCSFLMLGDGPQKLGDVCLGHELLRVRVGRPPVWAGADGPREPLFLREHLLELRDARVPGRHRERPRREWDGGGDLQGVVVDHDQPLGLGRVTVSKLLPTRDVAEGQARAAPCDAILRLGAVLPVRLDIGRGDRRAVLEDSVLTQLDRPDGLVLVDLVVDPDVRAKHAELVDLVNRAVNPRREDALSAAVAPGSYPGVAVGDPDFLRIVQSRPRRRHRRWVHREDWRQRGRRSCGWYRNDGWRGLRVGCCPYHGLYRRQDVLGRHGCRCGCCLDRRPYPGLDSRLDVGRGYRRGHRAGDGRSDSRLDVGRGYRLGHRAGDGCSDGRLDAGRGRRRGRLGAGRHHRKHRRNQQETREAPGAVQERIASCVEDWTPLHDSSPRCSYCTIPEPDGHRHIGTPLSYARRRQAGCRVGTANARGRTSRAAC